MIIKTVGLDNEYCQALPAGVKNPLAALFNKRKPRKGKPPVAAEDMVLRGTVALRLGGLLRDRTWLHGAPDKVTEGEIQEFEDKTPYDLVEVTDITLTHEPIDSISPSRCYVKASPELAKQLITEHLDDCARAIASRAGQAREVLRREEADRRAAEEYKARQAAEEADRPRRGLSQELIGVRRLNLAAASKLAQAAARIEDLAIDEGEKTAIINLFIEAVAEVETWEKALKEARYELVAEMTMPHPIMVLGTGPRGRGW